MQSDNIEAGAKDLAKKIVSLNSLDVHAAINQYFDTHAVWSSERVHVAGASKIKAQFDLFNWLFTDSGEIGEPSFSSQFQTLTLKGYRVPHLARIPILNTLGLTPPGGKYEYKAVFHLNPDGDTKKTDDQDLLVTKVEVARLHPTALEGLVPWFLLRPILSLLIGAFAFIQTIRAGTTTHPSPVQQILGTIINLVVYLTVFTFQLVKRLLVRARSTETGAQVEKRGRDVQARVGTILEGQKNQLGGVVAQFQDKLDSITSSSGTTEQSTSPSKSGDKVDGTSQTSASSSSSSSQPTTIDDGPTTPLGGLNPNAPEAPSFAQVAAENGDHKDAPVVAST